MKRRYSQRKKSLFWVAFIITIAVFVKIGTDNKGSVKTEELTLTRDFDSIDVSYNELQRFYLLLNPKMSFEEIRDSLDSYGFVYNDFSRNSCYSVRIGFDLDVIKQYHAADGESIEVKYPRIQKEMGQPAYPYLESFIYNFDAKRHYTLIQLFPIEGYTSSYLNHKEIGICVREWPPREGIDEYTMFDSVEAAMKYIIANAYQ